MRSLQGRLPPRREAERQRHLRQVLQGRRRRALRSRCQQRHLRDAHLPLLQGWPEARRPDRPRRQPPRYPEGRR